MRGEIPTKVAHQDAFAVNAAGKDLPDAVKFVAPACGQAAALALGAAACAIRAVMAAAPADTRAQAGKMECAWQREQLREVIRALILDDGQLRNHLCWMAFGC